MDIVVKAEVAVSEDIAEPCNPSPFDCGVAFGNLAGNLFCRLTEDEEVP